MMLEGGTHTYCGLGSRTDSAELSKHESMRCRIIRTGIANNPIVQATPDTDTSSIE